MTPEQKANNKNYILNHLDKYVIDSRQNFYGEEADVEFSYISKDALPDRAFEEIRDQIYQKIIQNKDDWEITDYNSESWHINSTPVYRHKATGICNHSAGFAWEQNNRLQLVLQKAESDRNNDRPSDNEDDLDTTYRQAVIENVKEQLTNSKITIPEIERLARDYPVVADFCRNNDVWPLSDYETKLNSKRGFTEISGFGSKLTSVIYAIAARRDEGDYNDSSTNYPTKYESYFTSNWYDEWKRENDDYLVKRKEEDDKWWKDFNQRQHDRDQKWDQEQKEKYERWLREDKEKAIDRIEEYLTKNDVSAKDLNQKLGKADWREEINKFTDYWSNRIQSKEFFIKDIIDKISRKFTCAGCGRTRDDIYSPHEEDGQKFCINYSCWEKYRQKNGKGDPDNKELKDEVKKLKDYLEEKLGKSEKTVTKSGTNPLRKLLEEMKKEGIVAIRLDLDSNQLVVEFDNHKSKTLENSELSAEQKGLQKFFMTNPNKRSFSRSELEKQINNTEEKIQKIRVGKEAIGGIIVIFLIGIIVAVIYRSAKKHQNL
jgi:hypothetical protein